MNLNIDRFNIVGYRSIRNINLRMGAVNVIVGANGTGKTNLYRSLYLLHAAADGRLARAIAEEGGMESAIWAGKRKKGPVQITLAIDWAGLAYELSFGLPIPKTAFQYDPCIKVEKAWLIVGNKRVCILDRDRDVATVRDVDGNRILFPGGISSSESILSELREPARFPELAALRQELLRWRFYHHFRTDADSPLRRSQIGVTTPALAHDGRDLVPAIATIMEFGNKQLLLQSIQNAFPGSILYVDTESQQFSLSLEMPSIPRPFSQQELSDGTLQYLCLATALLSPRPPALLALNEPETSLHPGLYPALADLLAEASRSSQLWVTTHSEPLARLIEEKTAFKSIRLNKIDGETRIEGHGLFGEISRAE